MHAFLIKTTNFKPVLKLIAQKLNIKKTHNHPDVLIINETPSISIKAIRNLKSWAQHKPYQARAKAALIINAHLMTLPAQNALLKTLEEPPKNTFIFLTTTNPLLLLETITSRCHLIKYKKQKTNQITDEIEKINDQDSSNYLTLLKTLSTASPGQKIVMAADYSSSRDTAIKFCQNLLPLTKTIIDTNPQALKLTTTALKRLKNNINPRLTIESLFLNL